MPNAIHFDSCDYSGRTHYLLVTYLMPTTGIDRLG